MQEMLIAAAALLASAHSLDAAQTTRLDLVPARASASLIFHSAAEFRDKGDKLIAAAGGGGKWASMAINYGAAALGVSEAYDPEQPLAVVWLNRSQVTLSEEDQRHRWRKPVAVVVFIRDLDALARQLKVDVQQLKDGQIITRKGELGYEFRHYRVRGDQLWISSHVEAIDIAMKGERLSGYIATERQKPILENDLILSFSGDWDEFNPESAAIEAERWIQNHADADEAEKVALRELLTVFQAARHAIFGLRVESDGLQIDLDVHFDPARHATIGEILRRISPSGGPSVLSSLPASGKHGELLVAHAARTDGKATLAVTSVILRDAFRMWTGWWDELDGRGFLNQSQQLEILGLFGEVWGKLNGYRSGLYQNARPERDGLISLISVLDTGDADQFLLAMKELGGLIDGTGIDAEDLKNEKSRSRRRIRRLISQLSAPDFATRQSAATRLILIGGPALAFVGKAGKSGDPTVARRARMVAARIRQSFERKRDEALRPSLLSQVNPTFLFHDGVEERESRPVHIIEMQSKMNPTMESHVAFLLGPDWKRVRLVPRDGQVVVLLGSNTRLLDTTLKNLARERSGLAADPKNRIYNRPLHRKHNSELHVSAQRFLSLLDGKPMKERHSHELISLSLTLQPAFFNVEWRLPASEIRAVIDRFWK